MQRQLSLYQLFTPLLLLLLIFVSLHSHTHSNSVTDTCLPPCVRHPYYESSLACTNTQSTHSLSLYLGSLAIQQCPHKPAILYLPGAELPPAVLIEYCTIDGAWRMMCGGRSSGVSCLIKTSCNPLRFHPQKVPLVSMSAAGCF